MLPKDTFLTFTEQILQLKQLPRQGWLQHHMQPETVESVADHCFGTTSLAMLLAHYYYPTLSLSKLTQLAMLHEWCEIVTGDITPQDGVEAQIKHDLELEGIRQLLKSLPNPAYWEALWLEFEEGDSAEAIFVRQLDKVEMAIQAIIYQKRGLLDATPFIDSALERIQDPFLRELILTFSASVNQTSPQ